MTDTTTRGAELLREWMTENQWSVRRLAGALGVSPQTVQRWRDGTHPVNRMLGLALIGLACEENEDA